jgi:hypothetical protein
MPTVLDAAAREALLRRLATLTPETPPRWGRLTAPRMLCHLVDSVESAFDAPSEPPGTGPLSRQPLKWLVLHVLPWPRGRMVSPARLTQRQPTSWAQDVAALRHALERVATRGTDAPWPPSEVFGHLSRAEWGALLGTHIDHHLRQFGA